MKEAGFGVVIACARHDYGLARGTCASIHHFMPDVPICLITDGDFASDELTRAYGVQILARSQVKNDWLRENSYGWGLTKMVAFWECPFERFLFLDADAVVYGDLRRKLALKEEWDFVTPDESTYGIPANKLNNAGYWVSPEGYTADAAAEADAIAKHRAGVDQFFFDTARIESLYPDFPWARFAERYFCTGTYAARRGAIPLEEYQEILRVNHAEKGIFKYAEMGFLNFIIFRGLYEKRYRVRSVSFQTETPRIDWKDIPTRFPIPPTETPRTQEDAWVIHFTNPKPYARFKVYASPMTYFRRQALKDARGESGPAAEMTMLKEDMAMHGWKVYVKRLLGMIPTPPVK